MVDDTAPEVTTEVTITGMDFGVEEAVVTLPASTIAEQLAGREALARVHANKPKVDNPDVEVSE